MRARNFASGRSADSLVREFAPPVCWRTRLSALRNVASLTLAAVALAGCGRDDVKVYHVQKDESSAPPPTQIAMPAPDQAQAMPAAQPQLKWTLPGGWQEIT